MNTKAAIRHFLRKLFREPLRREDDVAPREPRRITLEPAWLDHYLMHRDERSKAIG